MDKGWHPPRPVAVLVALTAALLMVLVFVYLFSGPPDWNFVVLASLPMAIFLGTVLLVAVKQRYILSSQHRITGMGFREAAVLLEGALTDGGLAPVTRRGRWIGFPYEAMRFDLKGGLELTVVNGINRPVIFLGPDHDGTRPELERVKGIVDGALEGMAARPPSRP